MARMRTVKPDLRTSEVVASWPFEVRYFFVLLWGYLDDKGRGLDVPKTIAGDCFPHDDKVTARVVSGWLDMMAASRISADKVPPLCRYEAGGRRYIHCPNFGEHQKPNRPTPSRLPPCPLHESLPESLSEPVHEDASEPPSGDSPPVVRGFDSREVEKNTPSPRAVRARAPADPPDFVRFWAAYPRRTDKGHARKAWAKAVKDGAEPETIVAGATVFAGQCARSRTETRFIPHPATWLSGERWTDQPASPTCRSTGSHVPFWDA